MAYKINLTDKDRTNLDIILERHHYLRHYSGAIQFAIERAANSPQSTPAPQPPQSTPTPQATRGGDEYEEQFREELKLVSLDDAFDYERFQAAVKTINDEREERGEMPMEGCDHISELIQNFINSYTHADGKPVKF